MEIPVELIDLGGEPRLCIDVNAFVLWCWISMLENVFVREAEPEPGHGSLDLVHYVIATLLPIRSTVYLVDPEPHIRARELETPENVKSEKRKSCSINPTDGI
ncbi:hypothetical protein HZH68_004715 [Vespula germanica]|uniref:Uncharacterized protein n=1 Tax=Vespula germanica TaxID=30212 RepID=A0A834KLW0_VESGE|nr:hypothetical protein HZH68_004715 [Vespula germanica]